MLGSNSQKRLKILSVSHSMALGGAENVKLSIDRYLRGRDFDLDVLSSGDGSLREAYTNASINVELININNNIGIFKYLSFRNRLASKMKAKGYDLVCANTLDTFWAVDAARLAKIPSIFMVHESTEPKEYYAHNWRSVFVRNIAVRSLNNASRIIFVSDASARLSTKYHTASAGRVINNGIDKNKIKEALALDKDGVKKELGIPVNKKVVSIIGTTSENKGQYAFAMAAKSILKNRDDVVFLIIGAIRNSYCKRIEKAVKGVEGIRLIERTQEVLRYYRITDIFVCASRRESFSLAILEATNFSIPIITTRVFGIPEYMVEGENALFIKYGDVSSIEKSVLKLLDDPALAERLGKNAYDAFENRFNEKDMVERYETVFREAALEGIKNRGKS